MKVPKKGKTRKYAGLPMSFEFAARTAGIMYAAGVDEAGRGPLAGPVVAAAVILTPDCAGLGIKDSKKLSPRRREELYEEIISRAAAWSIHSIGVVGVDKLNIYRASIHAMKCAINRLPFRPGLVFIDGPKAPSNMEMPCLPVVAGDSMCLSIAAASVLAKVSRDRRMIEYDQIFPGYGFAAHKGYGTKEHIEALRRLGPCPIHRRSFGPVKELMG